MFGYSIAFALAVSIHPPMVLPRDMPAQPKYGYIMQDGRIVAQQPPVGDGGSWPWAQIATEIANPTPHF